jgi:hypothetical protein
VLTLLPPPGCSDQSGYLTIHPSSGNDQS